LRDILTQTCHVTLNLYEAKVTETFISELLVTVINKPFNGTMSYGDFNEKCNKVIKANLILCDFFYPTTTPETDAIVNNIIDN